MPYIDTRLFVKNILPKTKITKGIKTYNNSYSNSHIPGGTKI